MMETSKTNFVKKYEPDKQSRVELKNGRILDVVNGRYFDAGTRVILQGGKIESMPGLAGEPNGIAPDYSIDLQSKTVLPSLFNTHCHLLTVDATMIPGLSDMRRSKIYREQQLVKNLADCLVHGITHIRDAWQPDLRENSALKERISKGEIPGPRIIQAVVVGPTGSYMQEKLPFMMKAVGGMTQVDPSKNYGGGCSIFRRRGGTTGQRCR